MLWKVCAYAQTHLSFLARQRERKQITCVGSNINRFDIDLIVLDVGSIACLFSEI